MVSQSDREKIGSKIKGARKKAKLTQEQVAKTAEINVNYFAMIERGEVVPSIKRLERILKILNLKSSEVLPF